MRMVKAALGRNGNIESIFRCQYANGDKPHKDSTAKKIEYNAEQQRYCQQYQQL